MKIISFEKIVSEVAKLCRTASLELPQDVLAALQSAEKSETQTGAKKILNQLIENAKIAKERKIPICQDTGLAVVFVELGCEVKIEPENKTLTEAINQGIEIGYKDGFLRKSVVAEPLHERKNTNTNTPAIIHTEIVPGDKLKITLMAKGGGCENKSQFKMFLPTDSADKISDWVVKIVADAGADACPPFVIGVGLGGNFEQSAILSKKALTRKLGSKNADSFYADMEKQILKKINALGVGPAGFGGDTTALAVLIETAPCHIASLPAAVNIECHAHRHSSIEL